MYRLIRYYNQNRRKILKAILIIAFIIGTIQLLNYFAKIENNKETNTTQQSSSKNLTSQGLVSDKSLVSGQSISSVKLKNDTEIIKQFIEKCNNKDITSAYNLLTEACKEEMFPTIQDFYNIYYMSVFNGQTRIYTVENWYDDIYQVYFTEDILASGNLKGSETKQDYITVDNEDGQDKLNINSYVGRKNIDKKTEREDVEITVTSIDTYMDYEIYNLTIKNNSENTILLDTNDDTESVYLLDSNDMKYYFYNNEIIDSKLMIQSQFTNTIQIKFNSSYGSSKEIEKLVFSKLVLDYEAYTNFEDKANYEDFYMFRVNV